MLNDNSVERIVTETVQNQLSPAKVNVIVRKGTDDDGDSILNATVVIETETPALDRRKMLGLVIHIRARLDEANSDEFPLLSFVSKREAAKLNIEAA